MALEIPLRKSNIGQNSTSLTGLSIWNKCSNDLKILNTATSFTYNYKKLVLRKLELAEHNFNHNFNHCYHYCKLYCNFNNFLMMANKHIHTYIKCLLDPQPWCNCVLLSSMAFHPLENFNHVVVSISIEFPSH